MQVRSVVAVSAALNLGACATPDDPPPAASDSTGTTSEASTSTSGEGSDGIDSSDGQADSTGSGGPMPPEPIEIPQEPWRIGDAEAGLVVLLYGNNTGGGVPIELYMELPGPPVDDVFERDGVSAEIPWFYNAYEAPNGVTVAAPSCLSCHGSRSAALGGEVIVGLGNVFEGGRLPTMGELGIVSLQVESTYGPESPEVEAFQPFFDGISAVLGHAQPPIQGTNAAFFLEEAAIAHRDPQTQAWLDRPRFAKATEVLASDIPPWWHLKKKHGLYYNGMGRGDAARLLMQSSVVGTFGLDHLVDVDGQMPDLLAYLLTIEAPAYPEAIDEALAEQGADIFSAQCAHCHGTYGDDEAYPNLHFVVVQIDFVELAPAADKQGTSVVIESCKLG
ncbi:MAG: hypothetical protein AAF721_15045, partial [Myxococcota bacterium]